MELEGIPGTSAAYERGAGFNEELENHTGLKVSHREVGNFSREDARIVTRQLLEEGKNFNAVFAHNDNMILGLIDAFEELDVPLPEILIGYDAIPEAMESVKQKKLTATIAQQPDKMGQLAILTATRLFRREKIPSEIFVDLSLITEQSR